VWTGHAIILELNNDIYLPMNKILMLRHLFSRRSGRDEWMQFGRREAIKEIADAFEIKLLNLENKQA